MASESLNQAVEYFEAGNVEEAIALLDEGLALDPNNPKAWNLRGAALYWYWRYENAIVAS